MLRLNHITPHVVAQRHPRTLLIWHFSFSVIASLQQRDAEVEKKGRMAESGDINALPQHRLTQSRQGSVQGSVASSSAPIPPGREYTQEEADAVPWKFIGYRVFSRWLATNQSFLIVRKFSAANTRVILWLQDQVADLEEQLAEIDDYCARRGTGEFDNGTFRNDPRDDRRKVIEQLQVKLNEYSMCRFVIV